MNVRRAVAGVGRSLIAAGVLILLFVAYQLWGTGLAEARAQDDLRDEFATVLAEDPPTPTTAPRSDSSTATTAAPSSDRPAAAPEGAAIAVIRIPKIDVEKAIVEGVSVGELKRGPGHYPSTPMPGQPGNSAIAGHRTTYGAPFFRLDELAVGDPIFVTTRQGRFRYEVVTNQIVSPKATEVLAPTDDNRLTLTTCHPRFSARQRLIVTAVLKGEAAEAPPAPPVSPTDADPQGEVPGEASDEPAGAADDPVVTLDEAEASLSGDPSARGPALAWGAGAALVWLLTWLLARAWRRLPAYVLGVPVFLVVLFVFFENVARLFPANV